jgi:MspA
VQTSLQLTDTTMRTSTRSDRHPDYGVMCLRTLRWGTITTPISRLVARYSGRRRIRLAGPLSRVCGRAVVGVGVGLALIIIAGTAMVDGPSASAEPSVPGADVSSPPPALTPVPSSLAAYARTTDGWTLTASANSETLTFLAPPDPARPTRDFIVGGVFNGTLRGPGDTTTPKPSGTIEVGYETHCLASGLIAAINPGFVKTEVLKQDFSGADVSTAIADFDVHVDCMGPALVRSYAVLTRTTNARNTIVAYYGVPTHV